MTIDYGERIPNNVDLGGDRRLRRALEGWQPRYLEWWRSLGPTGFQAAEVYLRTAVSVEAGGWARFGHVRMPDYRWGIFLAPPEAERTIGFGDHRGAPVWQDVPGEYRAVLRRLIVTQGDTEPASVEQQRLLGHTCPSLYDLRNLFQVNVEEGRHLWAMVYLLHAFFGRDGREEADEMLERHAGDPDKPRILGAFNEATPDWLSFYMFAFFTDRDGKYQLASLAESAFDPLSRTCRFMLTEEAHHLFVGESGIERIVRRACEIMRENGLDDPALVRMHGGIDLPTLQRYVNFHYSVSADLFGAERSTNAASYYANGLKGRYREARIDDDHRLADATWPVPAFAEGRRVTVDAPAAVALNDRLRQDFTADCARGVARWNKVIAEHGIDFAIALPDPAFHRAIGVFADGHFTPDGTPLAAEEWAARQGEWLPDDADQAFVASLMRPVTEPGRMANWIAPPRRGVDGRPLDYDYVRLA